MAWKTILTTFLTIFFAELGDKTQIAVLSLSAQSKSPISVFLGAVFAFAVVTLAGAVLGDAVARFVSPEIIEKIAALIFILIGILMFFEKI